MPQKNAPAASAARIIADNAQEGSLPSFCMPVQGEAYARPGVIS